MHSSDGRDRRRQGRHMAPPEADTAPPRSSSSSPSSSSPAPCSSPTPDPCSRHAPSPSSRASPLRQRPRCRGGLERLSLSAVLLLAVLLALLGCQGAWAQVLGNDTMQLDPLLQLQLVGNTNSTCDCSCMLNARPIRSNEPPPQADNTTGPWIKERPGVWNFSCDAGAVNVTSLEVFTLGFNSSIPNNISNLWALTTLDMSSTGLLGTVPSTLGLLAGLYNLDLSNNNLTGDLPGTLYSLTQLTSLTLQNNKLSGPVPPETSQLAALQHLDLGGNGFSGPFLGKLSGLTNLTYLNMSAASNSAGRFTENFDPKLDKGLVSLVNLDMSGIHMAGSLNDYPWSTLINLRVLNWTGMTFPADSKPTLPEDFGKLSRELNITYNNETIFCPTNNYGRLCPYEQNYNSTICKYCTCNCTDFTAIIVGSVVGFSFLLMLALVLVFFLLRAKEYNDGVVVQGVKRFTMQELAVATENYSTILGKGGFGEVYKGELVLEGSSELVAVKRTVAKARQKDVKGFDASFRNEVDVLSGVRHFNLVQLLGYSSQGADLQLVYEFIPRGSLDDLLRKEIREAGAGAEHLTWALRLHIAYGAASGLDYLHTGVNPPILHRDIKSSNILIDTDFNAKVADFGLSKIRPEAGEGDGTKIKGTPGYLDPDYLATGKPTEKSDVYSFGVVLLELATGWRPVDGGKHITSRVARTVKAAGFEGLVAASLREEMGGLAPYNGHTSSDTPDTTQSIQGGGGVLFSQGADSTGSRVAGADTGTSSDTGETGSRDNVTQEGVIPHKNGAATSTEFRQTLSQTPEPASRLEGDDIAAAVPRAVAPLSLELFVLFVKLGMQCCARAEDRPLMKSVTKAIGDLMEGRMDNAGEVQFLNEDDAFGEEQGDEVVVLTHSLAGLGTSTVAFVMDSGLMTR